VCIEGKRIELCPDCKYNPEIQGEVSACETGGKKTVAAESIAAKIVRAQGIPYWAAGSTQSSLVADKTRLIIGAKMVCPEFEPAGDVTVVEIRT
jgi:hypothetical protein